MVTNSIPGSNRANEGYAVACCSVTHTTWADWRNRHPDTLVLDTNTGFNRNYQANPNDGYERESSIMFPVRFRSEGYHPKEQVLGLVWMEKLRPIHLWRRGYLQRYRTNS